MNRFHQWYCRSDHWAGVMRQSLFDWTIGGRDLGTDVLELGPGTGVVTSMLADNRRCLTTVDPDVDALSVLHARTPDVRSVGGDATQLPFAGEAFTSVLAFTMLHHIPGRHAQRRLVDEAYRVLAPGGWFIGCDPQANLALQLVHLGDTFAPVSPEALRDDLRGAGFAHLSVEASKRYMRWAARRP